MTFAILSYLLAGLTAFAMLFAFAALVPRLVSDRKSVANFFLQWTLILALVVPATIAAILGPLWIYAAFFNHDTTSDHRVWMILAGGVLLAFCVLAVLRSAPGRTYSSWRSRVN